MFNDIKTEEEFLEKQQIQLDDDKAFAKILSDFAEEGKHRHLNFALINVGNVLKICSIYLQLEEEKIEGFLKIEKLQTRNRKMNGVVNELNEKINLRYEFDDKAEIIEEVYVFEGQGYIRINKVKFLNLLMEKDFIDPADKSEDNLEKL